MNSIFKIFQSKPIESINELSNEVTIEKLLTSIEPNIGNINVTIDTDYGIRYGNFVSIIDTVMKYLLKHPKSTTFNSQTDFKSLLNINDIIQKDKNQLILLAEMIIFISSISSNKESLDNLENCDNDLIALYLNIKEKYTKQTDDYYSTIENNNEEGKPDESTLQQISELNKEIDNKNEKINNLIKLNDELDCKYKDALMQIERAKENEENNSSLKEDLINEQAKNSTLTNELKELKYENESLKKKLEEEKKSLTFKLNYTQEKLLSAEDKLENFKSLNAENEKLKAKLKEFSLLKDKEIIINEKDKKIESLNKLIETITKDKETLNAKNGKLIQDVYELKEESRKKNNTIKSLEKLNEELKKENKRIDNILKQNEMKVSRPSLDISQDLNKKGTGFTLSELNKEVENQNNEKEINELKQELETYKDCLNTLNSEKDKLTNEKDKIYFEKEKCLNELQQLKLEKQKNDMENENKIKKLQNDISLLKTTGNLPSDITSNLNNDDEVSSLKNQIIRQQEIIEALKSRIENEDDIFNNSKEENKNNENDEINKYIKENKEMKNRIIKEHELISSSFYELALQFMRLQENNEIKNNILNNNNNTWIEKERKKNFPFDYYQE
jgi:hypothetical protein